MLVKSIKCPSIDKAKSLIFLSFIPLSVKCKDGHLDGLEELGIKRNTNVHFIIMVNTYFFGWGEATFI